MFWIISVCDFSVNKNVYSLFFNNYSLDLKNFMSSFSFSETDDYKEIPHKAIITLADFYGVTSDYLLGQTENREQHQFPVDNYFNNLLGNDIVKIAKAHSYLLLSKAQARP